MRAVALVTNEDGVSFTRRSGEFGDSNLLSSPEAGFTESFGAGAELDATVYARKNERDDTRRKDREQTRAIESRLASGSKTQSNKATL